MSYPTHDEYLAIDGVPLSTPAWSTEDIASLIDGPDVRGNDIVVPTRAGAVARRRVLDARRLSLPIAVTGVVDSDNIPFDDVREGLQANLDELKRVLSPNTATLDGTRLLEWVRPNEVRSARVHISPAVSMRSLGTSAVRMVVNITIPGGVLRSPEDEAVATLDTGEGSTVVIEADVAGSGEVQDAVLVIESTSDEEVVVGWGDPSFNITSGTGAPTPGAASTGAFYFDLSESPPDLYGPRDADGSWPGPVVYVYEPEPPTADDKLLNTFWVVGTGGMVQGGIYGPYVPAPFDVSNLRITQRTVDPSGGVFVEYPGTIDDVFEIDAGAYSAKLGTASVSGSVISAGSPIWFQLLPGVNEVEVSGDVVGEPVLVTLRWRSVWL
jgi:hypothetical protein